MGYKRQMPDVEKVCPNCGVTFVVPPKQRKAKFCGHRCAAQFHLAGKRNQEKLAAGRNARGDKLRGTGKKARYVKRNGRHEHRVIAEKKIGRKLIKGEVVHHEDENGKNNTPSNLHVLPSQSEHARLHAGKTRKPRMICKNGHALIPENIAITSAGRRRCLICQRTYDAKWRRDKRKTRKGKT